LSRAIAVRAGVAAAAVLAAWVPGAGGAAEQTASGWWVAGPGDGVFAAAASYDDPYGSLTVLNTSGSVATAGHPFFTPLGTNGRACVTCHQPVNGMSVAAATLQRRWVETNGKDPVFAPIDGSNCPTLPQDARSSHSLLLEHGLFRIFVPWPPKAPDGSDLKPEFDIEVVKDPTGCNTDPTYGLHSAQPFVSVFRRPRPAANLKYVTTPDSIGFNVKTGMPLARDPETRHFVSMQLMSDSRYPTLKAQAANAALAHEQTASAPSDADLERIEAFESQVYAAQTSDRAGGAFTGAGEPPGLGPLALAGAQPGILGDDLKTPVFQSFALWEQPTATPDPSAEFRASVARGAAVYMNRAFWIRDSANLNTIGLGNPVKRTCSTCHNAQMTGMDLAAGWMDIGTNNLPYADPAPYLPLFKVTCHASAPPHPFLGRVIYTHDPGRALISGLCVDVGSITMQQLRALAARAPYFADGSAADLAAVVDFYDRRYEIHLTPRERQDLINLLTVL
jgi:hypothetical protein